MPETEIGGDQIRFQPTAWTVVREARDGSGDALDTLMDTYWKPVYFFIRRRGNDIETSKDLAQGFFANLLERDFLRNVSAEKGRFRTFVLAALQHFLSNERDRAAAKKRGGGWNLQRAEVELASADPTPEEAFRRQWAAETLARAMMSLKAEASPEDMALLAGADRPDLSVTDRKNRLHRLRLRLRELLREVIRPSVDSEGEVESEIREIHAAIS